MRWERRGQKMSFGREYIFSFDAILPSVNVGSLTTKHCHPFVAPFLACVPVLEGIYTNLIFRRKLGIPNTENTENA